MTPSSQSQYTPKQKESSRLRSSDSRWQLQVEAGRQQRLLRMARAVTESGKAAMTPCGMRGDR